MTNTTPKGSATGYLTTAETIVREAGAIARSLFGKVDVLGDHGDGNVFTTGDVSVNEHICRRLIEAFPDHDILSEESGRKGGDVARQWILDPIDGTRYFQSGIPLYSISLAYREDGTDRVGVVYNPETDQLFSAETGAGAFLNGNAIRCSTSSKLHTSTVCVEIPHRNMSVATLDAAQKIVAALMGDVDRIRIIGASALGLCYCANGAFDLYLNISTGSKEWDLAAGRVVLRESGAIVSEHGQYIVGGPADLRQQLLQLLPGLVPSDT